MRKTTHYCVIANNIQVRLIEYIKLTPAIRLRADLRRVFLNVFNNKNYGTIFILSFAKLLTYSVTQITENTDAVLTLRDKMTRAVQRRVVGKVFSRRRRFD